MESLIAGFIAGGAFFGFMGFLLGRARVGVELATARERLRASQASLAEAQAVEAREKRRGDALQNGLSEAEKRHAAEAARLKTLLEEQEKAAPEKLRESFRAFAASVLQPVGESLSKVQRLIQEVERERVGADAALRTELTGLAETQKALHAETANLVKALRNPTVRGRWGEIQLRRVVELAGMLEHCDFEEQRVETAGEERKLRPDLQIRLPGGKTVVVDAKVPCHAYLDAVEAKDEATRDARLKDHARQLRDHVTGLGSKAYWDELPGTPDFVVLFLPGEAFLSAAWDEDPALLEYALAARVMVATPVTLIALLKAVAFGWRQEKIAQSAQAISDLGRAFTKRAGILVRHFDELGRSLGQAVGAYNRAVGSLEGGVLVTARRFEELGVSAPESLREVAAIERFPRSVRGSLSDEDEGASR